MRLTVNGEPRDLPDVRTVADVLRAMGLDRAPCAVEVNRALVPKPRHASAEVREGDRLEVVTLVGGG
jgi:sulfur carrier protein